MSAASLIGMTLTGFIILLVIAGICGLIAQAIVGTGRGGFLTAIVLGFIGAVLGVWLAGALHLPELFVVRVEGRPFPILWSIIGAALFVALVTLIAGRRTYTPTY